MKTIHGTRLLVAACASLSLAMLGALGGCGGKVGDPVTVADSGLGGGGGHDGITIMEGDGGVCVDISLTGYDTSCVEDTDCQGVTTGEVCSNTCFGCVPNAAINQSSESLYEAQTAPLSGGVACACPASGQARCLSNACVWCSSFGDSTNPACNTVSDDGGFGDDSGFDDGGFGDDVDSGFGDDSGFNDGGFGDDSSVCDASTCVFIDPTDYSTDCNVSTDCALISEGQVCSGDCECGGSPINIAGLNQYNEATSGIQFGDCPCAATPNPACSNGTCVSCGGNAPPPECAQGG